ncbi:amino acid permease 8-like [Mangifera indica]|uniref:amino acid permease 8-like n=1 Tax=Mangifera indica TaxID=29780 RepID=UPI001CFC3E64|nr:amino acid permease 8-like [Mangifera indica]
MGSEMEAAEDGHIRTGTLWTCTAHAFTAILGSGILSLPWSVAQLGWIMGPFVLVTFAAITYYAAVIFSDCYRSPDPITGRRNRTYIDAVRAILGPTDLLVCSILQYIMLWGTMIGYTITATISAASLKKSTCFHAKGQNASCGVSGNLYMLIFGAIEIILSQCPNLEKITFLSIIASVTSFLYSAIALSLSIAKFSSHLEFKGTFKVANSGTGLPTSTKIWKAFQGLGNIAFAYSYSNILLEIQDTLKSPPHENTVMKKATLYAVGATTLFYISLGCMGYAAYGNDAPGNILAGYYNLFWLVDIANLAVVIHLIGAYQVFSQPLFAVHETWIGTRWPTSFFNTDHTAKLPFIKKYTIRFTLSKLLLRTVFVTFTTAIAMMFPFFTAILGLLGAVSFWPLTVYLPVSMYIVQAKIKRGSSKWILFQILGLSCLIVTLLSAIGSFADILEQMKHAKLFHLQI